MSTNVNSNKQTATQRRNEMVTSRLSLLFLISTVMCIVFLTVQNNGSGMMYPFRTYVCPAFMIVSAVGIVMSILWSLKRQKEEGYRAAEDYKVIKPSVLIVFFAALFAVSFMYYTVFRTNQNYKSIVTVIIFTVIAIIYDCFSRDFFWFSAFTASGAVLMLTHVNGLSFAGFRSIVFSLLQLISVVAPAVLFAAILLTDKNGTLSVKNKKIYFLGRGASKWSFFVLAVLLFVMNAGLCFVNAGLWGYAVIVLFAFYLLYAVVYAVKQLSK